MIVIDGGGLDQYLIFLFGCHDVTSLHVELTPTEAGLIRELSRMSRAASDTDCQPRMCIVRFDRPDIDKVVSIDEQNPIPSPFGSRARLRLAGGVAGGEAARPRGFGGGGGVWALAVGDALSAVAGEDRPR